MKLYEKTARLNQVKKKKEQLALQYDAAKADQAETVRPCCVPCSLPHAFALPVWTVFGHAPPLVLPVQAQYAMIAEDELNAKKQQLEAVQKERTACREFMVSGSNEIQGLKSHLSGLEEQVKHAKTRWEKGVSK